MVEYEYYCSNPNNMNLHILDWLKNIWIHKNWYITIFYNPLEKLLLNYGPFES